VNDPLAREHDAHDRRLQDGLTLDQRLAQVLLQLLALGDVGQEVQRRWAPFPGDRYRIDLQEADVAVLLTIRNT
jgi:hypothetical protein